MTSYGFKKDAARTAIAAPFETGRMIVILAAIPIACCVAVLIALRYIVPVLVKGIVIAARWTAWTVRTLRWVRTQPDRKVARQQVYALLAPPEH